MQARLDTVKNVLSTAPYVFLAGLSGAGKTQFVKEVLCKDSPNILYQGESAIKDWAKDNTPGTIKYLFLDEANLSARQWTEFEGLFQKPPSIYLDGAVYPLSEQHRVIFAGNPLNYGDERTLAPFFERHGNTVWFDMLPTAVLYEQVLKPVFQGTSLEDMTETICGPFLIVYSFLCHISPEEVLISPRELQMMALLVLSWVDATKEHSDILAIARHFAYQLAAPLVPAAGRAAFDAHFKPLENLPAKSYPQPAAFLITKSREPIYQLLQERLALRDFRRQDIANEVHRYGGLGGIILEGAPGVGKSELVIAALTACAYEEVHDFEANITMDKPFYRMPVSLSIDKKEALLRKAFDEGAIVIIDEINSSPMMEQLLNALLMGKTPEGRRPAQPGFMVIGTQNPITLAGRRAPSTALARRLTTITVPEYPTQEVADILCTRGLPKAQATSIAKAYTKASKQAKKYHYTPAPTLREVLHFAKKYQQAIASPASSKREEPLHASMIGTSYATLFSGKKAGVGAANQQLKRPLPDSPDAAALSDEERETEEKPQKSQKK